MIERYKIQKEIDAIFSNESIHAIARTVSIAEKLLKLKVDELCSCR